MIEDKFSDLKKNIHDSLYSLVVFLHDTKHPALESIRSKIKKINYDLMYNLFECAEIDLIWLIDFTKRFEITWDCMDCLEQLRQAEKILKSEKKKENPTQTHKENLRRVNKNIRHIVFDFCKKHVGREFHLQELEDYVRRERRATSGSPGRILRLLQQEDKINYDLISRSNSTYKILSTAT